LAGDKNNSLLLEDGNNNVSVTVTLNQLKDFVDNIIAKTKKEWTNAVLVQNQEQYISAKKACELLDTNNSTLYR
jgi:hypothetical protein